MSKKFLIFITVFFSILASKGNLYANGASQIYAEGPVSKIGFSTSSSATEPDADTIKTLSSPYTLREAYNTSYLNNTSIGQNSLMYTGELQPGTYRKFFFYYDSITYYYDDGTTTPGYSNWWGAYTIPGDALTISDNENGRIQFNWTGTAWEVTKTSL